MATEPIVASPMFDDLGVWLMDQGLREASVEDLVQGYGQRLTAAGLSIHRVGLGGLMLHPIFGAIDVVWEASHDAIVSKNLPRGVLISEEFRDAPFFRAASQQIAFERYPLAQPDLSVEFPIFQRLRDDGVTDYLVFFESYGRTEDVLWADLPPGMEGVLLSISTRRVSGFSDFEINYLRSLMRPLALAVKSTSTYQLARALLQTYLGSFSGERVLDGLVERGDGGVIECVLFYCDLRQSTKLAETMALEDYLAMINCYFDCTAGAVSDHGGEVLKFIGDAVMAIFPIDPDKRPAVDMTRAALSAAREAFDRCAGINDVRAGEGLPPIDFGVSLHVGRVMYGNVGTDRRLDFTVIGPAANEVTRLEGLCKLLDTSLVASQAFADAHAGEMRHLGRHELAGVADAVEVYTLAE